MTAHSRFTDIMFTRSAVILCASSIVLLLAGCSPTSGVPTSLGGAQLWAQDIAQAKVRATSDFERAVFDDDTIDQSEYSEAMQRYISCVNASGYPGSTLSGPDSDGIYHEETSSSTATSTDDFHSAMDAYMAVSAKCAQGTSLLIASLYEEQKRNPQHQDYDMAAVQCLQEGGFVDSSYTVDQFRTDSKPDIVNMRAGGNPPYDVSDPAVETCLSDPYSKK